MCLVPAQEDSGPQVFRTLNNRYGGVPLPLEILELVLCHVPRRDVLRQMGVCKVWAQASFRELLKDVSTTMIMDKDKGLWYLQHKHQRRMRLVRWNQGLLPLLQFFYIVPEDEMSHGKQKKEIPLPCIQLFMGDYVGENQPELDRVDTDVLSPTAAAIHFKILILSHNYYCSNVHANTNCIELSQRLTALLSLFPRVTKLNIPSICTRWLDSTMPAVSDVVCTSMERLYERGDLANLRLHLVELVVDRSIFTLMDNQQFFESGWYLTRLRLSTAYSSRRGVSTQMNSHSYKRLAHLLMEYCPNVEEVGLSSSISQYFWHIPVDDGLQSLSWQGEDVSANKKERDSWKPLHRGLAGTLAVHELYPNQNDKTLSPPPPPPPPQLLYRVHPKLKSISAANTLTITDLQCLSQPCYSRQLTHLIITRYRDNSTVHCLIPMGLQLVLQNASALIVLSVRGCHLSPLLMAPPSTLTFPLSRGLVGIDSGVLREQESRSSTDGFYKPWACLGLQLLQVPVRCETVSVHEHQRVFEQLGKLRQLQILDLTGSSLLFSKRYGIEALRGLTKLHTIGYKTDFLPSKDGFQWLLSSESQLASLKWFHISIVHRIQDININKLFMDWRTEVSESHKKFRVIVDCYNIIPIDLPPIYR